MRLSYFKNASGSAEVLEKNNFYPFGLKHEGYNPLAGNPSYQYKYNGKELQTESGMLDYGWRQYMPELGRWNGVDQLSEMYSFASPFAYVANNPVMMFDPDGRKISPVQGNGPGKDAEWNPDKPGGANNPALIEEIILDAPLKPLGVSSGSVIPYSCEMCYSGNGITPGITLPLSPAAGPPASFYQPVLHNGSAYMMSGDMFGFTDLIGTLFTSLEPDNQEQAIGFAALAIIATKGRATPGILKTELAIERAEMTTIYRNFGWNELNSVKNSGGKFSIHPNQFQGKQFWVGESGMKMWTNSSFAKPFTAKISIPKSFVTPGHKNYIFMESDMIIDGFPGGTVLPNNLQKFNSAITIDWIRY